MSAFSWSAKPRPNGATLDIIGARCRCGRRVYVLVMSDDGTRTESHMLGRLERCRGCDEAAQDCWCPEIPLA